MNVVRVKICGITRQQDAARAVRAGAWALGFVFFKKSPRYIPPLRARTIIKSLPPFVAPVGVFVDETEKEIRRIAELCRISTLQFHGDETPAFCQRFKGFKIIKAVRVGEKNIDVNAIRRYPADAILLDTFVKGIHGGTGRSFDWALAGKIKRINKPLILSGGINSRNAGQAIDSVRPFALDVSSGVELRPGIKNRKLLDDFFACVKKHGLL